ncbi:GNAT family N-acetyltransferase [Geomicrobium sediminis]|uniref:GNAT superfamily N-acetyltransferase n=1 Tax=Geomicrobium sediminis TaxID=1347788 RepID=A0ABS2PCU1_9BACL|nr:GNAT family N-acetyltransferase [Geomicrobium sediminis]MBM7633262.1 GNAT superfamily N-acetyltransferase [Geomicrobium sediminis]
MIEYKDATNNDFERLVALRTTAMIHDFKRHDLDLTRTKEFFRKSFKAVYTKMLYMNDEWIGCVALHPDDEYDTELKHFYIHAAYRGQGIGKYVLQSIIERQRLDNKNLCLYVFKESAAIPIYEKHGFVEVEVGDFTHRLALWQKPPL